MKIKLRLSLLILSLISIFIFPDNRSEKIYNFTYFIQGNAKGKIFLVIPFKLFYQASASIDFIANSSGDITEFNSLDIGSNGYMIRTLGFSGKSLAILVSGKDKIRMKKYFDRLLKNFRSVAPGFAKSIYSYYFDYFYVNPLSPNSFKFKRSKNGIHSNIYNNITLRKSEKSSKNLKINFNIYKILAEVLNIFNHSFLPQGFTINDLDKLKNRMWKSPNINFTDTLKKSSKNAAKIFNKIKGLGQKRSFIISYKVGLSDNKIFRIVGSSFPGISIWNDLKIKKFERSIDINRKDLTCISDKIKVTVSDNSGNGGYFISYLKLKNRASKY